MADVLRGGIAINEVLVDPNGATNFDTDGSGSAGSTDEFIELVNVSDTAIDISGLELWDAGMGHWFTFPPGTILQPGAHALVMPDVEPGGSLPVGGPDDLSFDANVGGAVINNDGDNLIVYDPGADEYIAAVFNGVSLDDPTEGEDGYSGFSETATQSGSGENLGFDSDGNSLQRLYDTSDMFVSDTPTPSVANICFVNGTAFSTPCGERAVETLRPGDLVHTLDRGPKEVQWIHSQTWSVEAMRRMPRLAPVLITKGALGNGLPWRDLRISRQHRIMVRSAISQRMFNTAEVLVAAKHLIGLPGVFTDTPTQPVTYFHVMLDLHEVLFAEGQPTESLYLGEQALKAIPEDGLCELETLLGNEFERMRGPASRQARQFADGIQARNLVHRHRKNRKPLVDARRANLKKTFAAL